MINCWEYMNCGRQYGGKNTGEWGVCPAGKDTTSSGLNRGKYAGRICWAVSGTLCDGVVQGSFAQKETTCLSCKFYNTVRREEDGQFALLKEAIVFLESLDCHVLSEL